MVKIIPISQNTVDNKTINLALKHLKKGGLIIYPTDTSYGIGAVYSDERAVGSIYKLKCRDESKKLSVVIPSIEWAKNNLKVNPAQENILRKYLPGKYTFILQLKNSNDTLAVRIPGDNFIQLLVRKLGEPITATSANISGQGSCYGLEDLHKGIFKKSELYNFDIYFYNAGELKTGELSTVIDITKTHPKIVRQGSGKF